MVFGPSGQFLSIHLPSATTVSFTVSTRPLYPPAGASPKPPRSLLRTLPILTLIKHVIRIFFVFCVLLVNATKLQVAAPSPRIDAYAAFWPKLSLLGGLINLVAEK